jgi:hypothetical protein
MQQRLRFSTCICILIMMMGISSVNAADMNAADVAFIDGFLVLGKRQAAMVGPLHRQWLRG